MARFRISAPVQARQWSVLALVACALGCGTTRWTDTQRTATEQLLISDAVDQAVTYIDFSALEGKTVFVDPQFLDTTVVDKGYLISSVRQHLLASGCIISEDRAKATYVIEVRSGGIGTDRYDLLFGVPAMSLPTFLFATLPGMPAQTPEVALAKRTKQTGAAKIAVFAYNRVTGQPVWQSGTTQASSYARHTWVLGAGPFQNGTIRDGTRLAGEELRLPLIGPAEDGAVARRPFIPVTQQAAWVESPVKDAAGVKPVSGSEKTASGAEKPAATAGDKPATAADKPAAEKPATEKATPARVNLMTPLSAPAEEAPGAVQPASKSSP